MPRHESVDSIVEAATQLQRQDQNRRDWHAAIARYRHYRKMARELLEEQLLAEFRMRIDVIAIDDDILRKARRDWYFDTNRRVNWDWESQILAPARKRGCRGIELALVVQGKLCGLAVAKMSRRRKWLSLTHIEGAPTPHPLKGEVLPIVLAALSIYSALIVVDEEDVNDGEKIGEKNRIGIRVLNPTNDAMPRYRKAGYNLGTSTKRLRSIIIEEATGD